jgi:Arc/MetJ-type ribon-helix-helix transcriptional regulator
MLDNRQTIVLICQTRKKGTIMSDLRISVRLDEATRRRLEQEAAASGQNESDLVRAALAAYLEQRPHSTNCLELAKRYRLIGCAKNLPADLSTNREHFEGFGT